MPEPLIVPFGYKLKPEYRKGLVGHWKMNVNSGLMLPDLSGNNNHGTLTNMDSPPSATSGWAGQGLSFDGVDDYVEVNSLSFNTSYHTISLWTKNPSLGNAVYGIFYGSVQTNFNNEVVRLYLVTATQLRVINDYGIGISYTPPTLLGWHHIVYVYNDNGVSYLYWDGSQVGQDSNFSTITAVPTISSIGTGYNVGYPLNGIMDDIRIYNRALSADEVAHSCFQQEEEWDLGLDDDLALQGIPIPILQNQVRY